MQATVRCGRGSARTGTKPCCRGSIEGFSSIFALLFSFPTNAFGLFFDFKVSSIDERNPGLLKISLISESKSPRAFCPCLIALINSLIVRGFDTKKPLFTRIHFARPRSSPDAFTGQRAVGSFGRQNRRECRLARVEPVRRKGTGRVSPLNRFFSKRARVLFSRWQWHENILLLKFFIAAIHPWRQFHSVGI